MFQGWDILVNWVLERIHIKRSRIPAESRRRDSEEEEEESQGRHEEGGQCSVAIPEEWQRRGTEVSRTFPKDFLHQMRERQNSEHVDLGCVMNSSFDGVPEMCENAREDEIVRLQRHSQFPPSQEELKIYLRSVTEEAGSSGERNHLQCQKCPDRERGIVYHV